MANTEDIPLSEILLIGVDNFFEFPLHVRLTTLVIPVGLLFSLIGLSTHSWSASESERIGLWRHCSSLGDFECCKSIVNFLGNESPDWIQASAAFLIMAVFAVVGCGVVVVLTMCIPKYKDNIKISKFIWISYLITAFFLMISVSAYGGSYYKETRLKEHRLSGSFVCIIIAFVLYLCGGLAIIIMSYQGENKVTTIYIPEPDEPRPNSSLPDHYTWLSRRPIKTPNNWKHFNDKKQISEWNPHTAGVQLINVPKTSEWHAIETLVQRTWRKDLVGIGRDAKGLNSLEYNAIVVTKIERVENPALFEKYAENRAKLFRQIGSRDGNFPTLEKKTNVQKGAILTSKYLDKNVFKDIYPAVNEHYLFHGTPVQFVDAIVRQGLDARLNKRGMFGPAIYAAESSVKSDSYADPQNERDRDSEKKMILLRMLLGEIYVLNGHKVFKRPPCKICEIDTCSDKSHEDRAFGNWYYDSVVVDGKWNFREFLVYEMSKCYPEYVISYKRVFID